MTHRGPASGRRAIVAALTAVLVGACAASGPKASGPTVAPAATTAPVAAVSASATATTASPAATASATGSAAASAVPPAPTARPTSTATAAPATPAVPPFDRAIRSVDFGAQAYPIDGDGRSVTLAGGRLARGTGPTDPSFIEATLGRVRYGDLDGDGREEAAVGLSWTYGGTGHLTDVFVFRWNGSGAVLAASAGVGDRALDGVRTFDVASDRLVIDRMQGAAACCPERVVRTAWRLQGNALVAAGASLTLAVIDLVSPGPGDPTPAIRFAPGTDSAIVYADGDVRGTFDARAGQRVTVTVVPGDGVTGVVDLLRGATVLGTARPDVPLRVTLAEAGGFSLAVRRDGPGTLPVFAEIELTIR